MNRYPIKIGKNRLVCSLAFFMAGGLFFSSYPCLAVSKNFKKTTISKVIDFQSLSEHDLLKNSQISYRAEGGFTGIQTYGAIISCSNGKVSILKNVHDPRLHQEGHKVRQTGEMDQESYLRLWKQMNILALFKTNDAPLPKIDLFDEFTFTFEAQVGGKIHQFKAQGISRPEASRYFAIKSLIDKSAQMDSLWTLHSNIARQ